jgi:hypothetical protein
MKYLNSVSKSTTNKKFEQVTLGAIILFCLIIPITNPVINPCTEPFCSTRITYQVLKAFFFVEISIRIIARGLWFSSHNLIEPFLNSKIDLLDAFVISITTIDLVCELAGVESSVHPTLTFLRQLITLTPLRLIRVS